MTRFLFITITVIVLGVGTLITLVHFDVLSHRAYAEQDLAPLAQNEDAPQEQTTILFDDNGNAEIIPVTHVPTPDAVRAVYMTSWIASRPDLRKKIHNEIKESPVLNAVVIDIKDDTGKISFPLQHPLIQEVGSSEKRIKDIEQFIRSLHEDDIYVIGRVAVFQDPHLINVWGDEAVKRESDPEKNWLDRKGIGWLDASSERVWDYVATIAEESHALGFDEINFDYIRFPSDGNMADVLYTKNHGLSKSEVLESFFQYLDTRLRPQGIVISADIFGMTTVNTDDLGIGQVLEKTLPYFDFVAPMVYPSHFPDGWYGLASPAENPYTVIKHSMGKAVARAEAMGEDPKKLRPWLQDFNLGAQYTKELVEAQITATYEVGLDSWMMWDPSNTYTLSAYK